MIAKDRGNGFNIVNTGTTTGKEKVVRTAEQQRENHHDKQFSDYSYKYTAVWSLYRHVVCSFGYSFELM